MEVKYIKIQVVGERPGFVDFCISDQSHRGSAFGDHGAEWWYTADRFRLASVSTPEVIHKGLYVRGSSEMNDNRILSIPKGKFDIIKRAINDYNRAHGYVDMVIDLPEDLFTI